MNHLWFNYKDPKDHEFYFTGKGEPEISWYNLHQGIAPMSMHKSMFTDAVETFADEQQREKWMPLIRNLDILGCYA